MIIEQAPVIGIRTDLAYLDDASAKLGFVRWQWEYTRATYDYKIEGSPDGEVYYLRVNTRAVEGKLESPFAILQITDVYMGRTTFPHGLDYDILVPDKVMDTARHKLSELYQALKHDQLVEEVMLKQVQHVGTEASLYEAAQAMKAAGIGAVAVMDGEKLAGVVTERDLAIRGYAEKQNDALEVKHLLRGSVHSIQADHPVSEALSVMVREKTNGLAVVKQGAVVGMVTLDALAEKAYLS